VYLTSYFAEKAEPIFGLSCSYFLWQGRHRAEPLDTYPITGTPGHWDLTTELGRARAHTQLLKIATKPDFGAPDRAALLERLADAIGLSVDEFRRSRVLSLMTREEVAGLAGTGIDVQLHTHRHRMPADRALFQREIADNRAFVDPLRSEPARHFCYPSGEYTAEARAWLPECGIQSATTCDPGLATPESDDLLLPRVVDTMSLSTQDFVGWLTGASALFRPRKAQQQLASQG
jgi:peptidoglycan/xylan/chitin deacetylase (PgdA/CDA1 family)